MAKLRIRACKIGTIGTNRKRTLRDWVDQMKIPLSQADARYMPFDETANAVTSYQTLQISRPRYDGESTHSR